jgi:hypothetical protein
MSDRTPPGKTESDMRLGALQEKSFPVACNSGQYPTRMAVFIEDAKEYARAEVSSLESQRDTALANADFWERELNNFRRNAAHRAEQLAKEKVESLESRLQAVTKALQKVKFIASEEGHSPCRCGGIGPEGVCSNTCFCEWAKQINEALTEPTERKP